MDVIKSFVMLSMARINTRKIFYNDFFAMGVIAISLLLADVLIRQQVNFAYLILLWSSVALYFYVFFFKGDTKDKETNNPSLVRNWKSFIKD